MSTSDGLPYGAIQRSSKAPDNSCFKTGPALAPRVTSAPEGNNADSTEQVVTQAFDPPLYDKSKERVEKSHYFVKDFRPLKLSDPIKLKKGRTLLRLRALKITGQQAIDVHSIELVRK